MGKLEQKHTQKRKRADLQRLILGIVSTAGILSVGLVAPNVIGAMGKLGLLPTGRQNDSIRNARNKLIRSGLLFYDDGKLRLTKRGEDRLRIFSISDYQLLKPKRWDGRWRVLIFDIPERRKSLRDKIRKTLIAIGFFRLQDSVWIYPYDCEDLIVLLKADFKIGKDILYMIVDTLEHDIPVRKYFNLK